MRVSFLAGGNRHYFQPDVSFKFCSLYSFMFFLQLRVVSLHICLTQYRAEDSRGILYRPLEPPSIQLSPLEHPNLRTLAISASADPALSPQPRRQLSFSYHCTAAWNVGWLQKCSPGSKLGCYTSFLISNPSEITVQYWLSSNVLKNHYFICFLWFCGVPGGRINWIPITPSWPEPEAFPGTSSLAVHEFPNMN